MAPSTRLIKMPQPVDLDKIDVLSEADDDNKPLMIDASTIVYHRYVEEHDTNEEYSV